MEPRAKHGRRVGCALVAASAAGLLLAWLVHPPFLRARWPLAQPAAYWAVDRDVGALEGLDGGLRPCSRIRAPYPVRVASGRDGGAWLVCAIDGRARGRHELWRVDRAARRVARHAIEPPLDLDSAPDGAAFALTRGSDELAVLLRFPLDGPPAAVAEVPLARCLAVNAAHVAVGCADGRLVSFDHAGFLFAEARLPIGCDDLAALDDGWCAVAGAQLVGCGAALEPRWAVNHALERARLGGGSGRAAWAFDELGARLLRIDAQGARELESPVRSLRAVVARADGGALVATDGALLCVTSAGEWRIGQGGFDALVDVCATR